MAVKKKPKQVAFYTNKMNTYLRTLSASDLLGMWDTTLRHGAIRSQLSIMDGLMNLLSTVGRKIPRNQYNTYWQLQQFNLIVEKYRNYILKFDTEQIDSDAYSQQEADMQLRLMNKISIYEDFIEKETAYRPPKAEEKDVISIQGSGSLSLADRKLI